MERLGHRPALNGVRGVAVAWVVSAHAFGIPKSGMGVDLFFVLSGFLITTLLLDGHYTTLRSFYAARARRLLPALVVLLVVYVFAESVSHDRFGHGLGSALIVLSYSANIVRATGHGLMLGSLGHTWSLAQEEQFYLVWPVVLLILLRANRRRATRVLTWLAIAMTVWGAFLAVAQASAWWLSDGPDVRGIGLVVGCLAALKRERIEGRARWALPVAIPAMAAITSMQVFTTGVLNATGALPFFCLGCAALVLAALERGSIVERALSSRPLVWLGAISYSVYLWHFPVLIAVGGYGPTGHSGPLFVRLWAVALSVAAGWLSYRYVEQPIRHSRRARRVASLVASDPV